MSGELVRVLFATRERRRLAKRLHQIEVQLVKVTFQVRQLEQQILAADLDELHSHVREHLPAATHLSSGPHSADISEHPTHSITSHD